MSSEELERRFDAAGLLLEADDDFVPAVFKLVNRDAGPRIVDIQGCPDDAAYVNRSNEFTRDMYLRKRGKMKRTVRVDFPIRLR